MFFIRRLLWKTGLLFCDSNSGCLYAVYVVSIIDEGVGLMIPELKPDVVYNEKNNKVAIHFQYGKERDSIFLIIDAFHLNKEEKIEMAKNMLLLFENVKALCDADKKNNLLSTDSISQLPEYGLIPRMNDLLYKIIGVEPKE